MVLYLVLLSWLPKVGKGLVLISASKAQDGHILRTESGSKSNCLLVNSADGVVFRSTENIRIFFDFQCTLANLNATHWNQTNVFFDNIDLIKQTKTHILSRYYTKHCNGIYNAGNIKRCKLYRTIRCLKNRVLFLKIQEADVCRGGVCFIWTRLLHTVNPICDISRVKAWPCAYPPPPSPW